MVGAIAMLAARIGRLDHGVAGGESRRPWAQLSTDQLLDRLEWSYSETGGFEPDVVWELARRTT